MNRPQVRQIEYQQVVSTREITGSEAEEILSRYRGNFSTSDVWSPVNNPNSMTFEEMIAAEELKLSRERKIQHDKLTGPKPTTFSGQSGYQSDVKFGKDEDLGFAYKIEITTDMNLPKY